MKIKLEEEFMQIEVKKERRDISWIKIRERLELHIQKEKPVLCPIRVI